MSSISRVVVTVGVLLALAQPVRAQHVTIPFLANAAQRNVIEFDGGECEPEQGGQLLACKFQQVFLTTDNAPPNTCMITTNAWDRVFRKETATHYVSTVGPEGICAWTDVATLDDGGGVKWTLTLKKTARQPNASPECRIGDTEVLSWETIRRPLPCAYVQPGGLRR